MTTIVVITTEIVLNGPVPDQLIDLPPKVDTFVWGVLVPTMGLDAARARSVRSSVHVHNSTPNDACPGCMHTAFNERNSSNV